MYIYVYIHHSRLIHARSIQSFLHGFHYRYISLILCTFQVKAFCNVEFREFHVERYPDHVRDLSTYAFKMLLMWVGYLINDQSLPKCKENPWF